MAAFVIPIPTILRRSHISPRGSRIIPVSTLPQSPNSTKPSLVLQNIAERLNQELPTLFSSVPDYSIYSSNVTFEDPLNKFRGISKYASNINFLNNSPVFSSANLTLHDTSIISDDTVRTRWTLSMVVNLPWSPCVAFTGQSDYVVHLSTGNVIRHYDYWDSLDDSKFFSFPAVTDLLAQCRPHVGPRDLGGFDLLRRTHHFQIRRFNPGIVLAKSPNTHIETWQPAREGDRLMYVAVLELSNSPNNERDLLGHANKLRQLLRGKSYATVGERHYYVRPRLRGQLFHEVWLELSDANAFVDI